MCGAFKDKTGKVELLAFLVRFARKDFATPKLGVWTYNSWRRMGAIREVNVKK